MTIILTGTGFMASLDFISSLLSNYCGFTLGLRDSDSSFRIVLPRCWVGIISMFVFSSNCHLLFITSKFCKMAIILTGRWLNLSCNLISSFFFYYCSFTLGLRDSNSSLRIVLSGCRISIVVILVFTTDSHLLLRIAEVL
jgi:hypothetical protein